jgi:hypothetical protein
MSSIVMPGIESMSDDDASRSVAAAFAAEFPGSVECSGRPPSDVHV